MLVSVVALSRSLHSPLYRLVVLANAWTMQISSYANCREVCKFSEHVFVFEPFREQKQPPPFNYLSCSFSRHPFIPSPLADTLLHPSAMTMAGGLISPVLSVSRRRISPPKMIGKEHLHISDISSHCIGTCILYKRGSTHVYRGFFFLYHARSIRMRSFLIKDASH